MPPEVNVAEPGVPTTTLNVTEAEPVPAAFVALTVELYVPAVVGVPETIPDAGSTVSPGGKEVAP